MIRLRYAATRLLPLLLVACAARSGAGEIAWQESPWFAERVVTLDVTPDVRLHINQPISTAGGVRADERPTRLLVFACPNGNTLEQTLGCKTEGTDLHWRYNIQHIAAQTRLLRSMLPDERIVLVVAEADGLSWPSWRRNHEGANGLIAAMIADWRKRFATPDARVTLAAHSGGGSFLWGVIEGADAIPGWVDRIAFLDANYSFDAETHEEKFRRWIEAGDHQLVVVAYDDREITLDGKKVVGPTGGTYRATHRMMDAFREHWPMRGIGFSPFGGMRGRGFVFYIHPNPDNKILHTVLVGEMNGLAHAQLYGAEPPDWPGLTTLRAYGEWVQPEPYEAAEAE